MHPAPNDFPSFCDKLVNGHMMVIVQGFATIFPSEMCYKRGLLRDNDTEGVCDYCYLLLITHIYQGQNFEAGILTPCAHTAQILSRIILCFSADLRDLISKSDKEKTDLQRKIDEQAAEAKVLAEREKNERIKAAGQFDLI